MRCSPFAAEGVQPSLGNLVFRKNLKLIKTTTTQHHNSRTTNLHNQTRKLRVRGLDMAFAQIVLNLAVRLAQPRVTESLHPLVRRLSVSPWD